MRRILGVIFPGLLLVTALSALPTSSAHAQSAAPCGIVDSVSFPFDNVSRGGYYVRQPFANPRDGWGYHSGEDWFNSQSNAYGDPVHAIANGLVTYSSHYGWGVDKGVVILEHTLRDNSVIYSVYGHMEVLNDHTFPQEGDCVQRGDIVGAIGDPRGSPHLHFEIRHKWPRFPGFGYTQGTPDLDDFESPTAYIINWQAWLNPGYKWHLTLNEPMTAPPALASDGTIYIATEGHIESYGPDHIVKFRYPLGTGELISYLSVDDRTVTAYFTEGEFRRYTRELENLEVWFLGTESDLGSLWDAGPLIFLHGSGGTLRIFDQEFAQRGQFLDVGRPQGFAATDSLVALSTGQRTPEVLLFSPGGQLLQRASLRSPADVAPAADGGVLVRSTHALWHVSPEAQWTFMTDDFEAMPNMSTLAADGWGSAYLFAGKDHRQLLSMDTGGQFRWQTPLDEIINSRPVIEVGGGCAIYLGSSDGRLAAINAATGELGQTLQIYPGDTPGRQAWIGVTADEMVYFAVSGQQIIVLDGRRLIGLPPNTPCLNPY
jgi:murein DD-endopeptidase MepM/ murein hydrolase activator NlpD